MEDLQKLSENIKELDESKADVDLNANDNITDVVKNAKSETEDLDSEKAEVDLNANDNITDVVSNAKSEVQEFDNTTATADLDADGSQAQNEIAVIKGELEEFDGSTYTAEMDVSGADGVKEDLSDSSSAASDLTTAVAGVTAAIGASKAEADRMGTERSLQKALFYEGLPITAENLGNIRDTLKQVEGAIPTQDAARGFYELAKGMRDANDVAAVLPHAFDMIKVGGIDVDKVMTQLPMIFDTYGIHGEAAAETTDYLTNSFTNLKHSTPEQELDAVTASMQQLSGLGFGIKDVVGWLGAFDDAGVSAEKATSALVMGTRNLAKQLDDSTFSGSKAEDALTKLGISAKNADGSFRPVNDILKDVIKKFNEMPDGPEKYALAVELFGSRAAGYWIKMKEGPDEYNEKVETTAKDNKKNLQEINTDTMTLGMQLQKIWNEIVNAPVGSNWYQLAAGIAVVVAAIGVAIPIVNHFMQLLDRFRKWYGEKFPKSPMEDVGEDATKAEGRVSRAVSSIKSKIDELLKTGKEKLKGFWDDLTSDKENTKLNKFINDIKTKISELKSWIKQKFGSGDTIVEDMFKNSDGTYERENNKLKSFFEKLKYQIDELRGKNVPEALFEGEEGKIVDAEGKLTNFINRVKAKLGELRDSNIWKMIFGDEKGSIDTETPMNKFSAFIDGIKNKIAELKETNIWKTIIGSDEEIGKTEGRITSFINDIKVKIDGLKNYNIYDRIWGKPGEGQTRVNEAQGNIGQLIETTKAKVNELGTGSNIYEKIIPKPDESGGKWQENLKGFFEKVSTTLKSFDWRGLGFSLVGMVFEAFAMGIGTYFGEQNLEEKQKEYDKFKRGEPYDTSKLTPQDIEQFRQSENVQKWQQEHPGGRNAQQPYDLDSWIQNIKQKLTDFKNWMENLKFPNLLDLILPKPAAGAGGKEDKTDLEKWIDDTKKKINDFITWIRTLNPISIIDILLGKKKEGKGGEDKDPLTIFIDDTKKKINDFLKWLETLKVTNIIDIILGKKKDEKGNDTEDPLTKFINEAKAKIQGFLDWIGSLKVPNLLEMIFGKGDKDKEDPLTTYINQIKQKLEEFKAWLVGKFNEIKGILKIDWSKIYEGLQEAKQWVMDRVEELKTFINTKKAEIEGYLKFKWDEIQKGLKEAQQWVYDRWDDFKKFMEKLPEKAKKWGGDIVQGLIDGIMGKIPGLETALNFIKKYFPQSPPEKGPLSDITASKSAGWINDVFVNPINNQLGNVGNALGGAWDNYWKGYENWRSTHYPNPSPGSMNWTSGGAWTNEVGGSSAPSGWEQSPLNWTTDTINNWDNTLGSTIPGMNDFTNAIGKATLGMANWNAGQAALGWASGSAGQPTLGRANWNAGQPSLGGMVSWNAGQSALMGASGRPSAGQAALMGVDETPIPLPSYQQPAQPTGHWERSTQKVNITFESGAFQGVDYQTSTKRAAMEGVGMGLELTRQSNMKGYKPRNINL